ncbi:hypothetical protein Lal_00013580 [Lupinus albus]|uniref:DUF7815 domain-containing protein n=1 Tax=Lupinus albus TaxID=3870 RepID=A0A6A4PXW6_LUPAL|nr:hypothetical protein Lalb_Chr10g0107231 [Lupinus albus]KAF1890326.1 hypothetical protein Lal_00013580 [Lupinus albus]
MSFEIPIEEIKQLQISLRKQANLSWYQPPQNDHRFVLPKLPSISETLDQLDPSPPYLRCKNCNGRLLRGLHSSICVFCGTHPHQDLPPDPIKFKDALGYRWLLDSLNLDGSEMVAPLVEENASNRGKNESKDEIPLSKLLDLEIRWPSESERIPQSGNSDSAAFQEKSSLNLTGVDIESFFYQRESVSDVPAQNLDSGGEMGTASDNDFQANENLSLFHSVQASEVATGSAKDRSGDFFSGWDANFKSAGSVHEGSKPFDPYKVDFDTISGSWTGSVGVKKNDELNPSGSTENDWFEADGWQTSNLEVPSQTGKSESTMNISGTKTEETANVSSAGNSVWMQDDQWQGSDNKVTGTMASDEANDSFDDAWDDFTGSASAQDSSSIISSSKITGQIGKSEITADLDHWQGSNNKSTDTTGAQEAVDSFDVWNDFTGTANNASNTEVTDQAGKLEWAKVPNDTKTAESASGSSTNFDWMQDNQWSSNKATNIMTSNDIDDSFDEWNDFAGSAVTQNPFNSEINGQIGKSEITTDLNKTKTAEGANNPSAESFAWMQDDHQWQLNNNKTDTVTINEVASPFDVWNDLSSLATTQEPSSSVWKQTPNQASAEQTSETNLLSSSNNSHDFDFSGLSQHDLFSGQSSSPVSSLAATNAHPSTASSNSVADVDATRGNSRGDASTAKVDVETLMSQMPDLSFMLESNLSIPPK